MNINDSVVLVTGGNRGLGKPLVQAFLEAGARLSPCSLSSVGSSYQLPGPLVRPSLPNWH